MEYEICPQNYVSFRVLECCLKNIFYKMYKIFVEWHNKFQICLESIQKFQIINICLFFILYYIILYYIILYYKLVGRVA